MNHPLEQAAPRVLIVEDNPINMKLAADVLEADGFRVERAPDAEQAKVLLESLEPDLILTDIALPGMDGLTFVRLCKAEARLQHVPIVALTAFAMKGDDAKALEAGCAGYITKPIQTRQFAAQVRKYLRNS
ncbi:MAG TPA: response regulator [Steroidobacteraceae bacterium]